MERKETRKSAFTEKVDFLSNLNKEDFNKRNSFMSLKNSVGSASKKSIRPSRFVEFNSVSHMKDRGRMTVGGRIPKLNANLKLDRGLMVSEMVRSEREQIDWGGNGKLDGLLSDLKRERAGQNEWVSRENECFSGREKINLWPRVCKKNENQIEIIGNEEGGGGNERDFRVEKENIDMVKNEKITESLYSEISEIQIPKKQIIKKIKEKKQNEQKQPKPEEKKEPEKKNQSESSHYNSSTDIIIESFERPRKKTLESIPPLLKTGVRLKKKKQYSNALEVFNEIIEKSEGCEEAFFHRGFLNERMGQVRQAVDDYQDFLKGHPCNAIGYFNLGICFGKLKEYERALEAFNQVGIEI